MKILVQKVKGRPLGGLTNARRFRVGSSGGGGQHLKAAYIVAYDDEPVYCGAEPYENGQMAQQLLQALAL